MSKQPASVDVLEGIPRYITKKENGLDWYYYLYIRGGYGTIDGDKYGGQFDYLLYFASPAEMEGLDKCERMWCKEKNIPFATGETIQEAWRNYNTQTKKR